MLPFYYYFLIMSAALHGWLKILQKYLCNRFQISILSPVIRTIRKIKVNTNCNALHAVKLNKSFIQKFTASKNTLTWFYFCHSYERRTHALNSHIKKVFTNCTSFEVHAQCGPEIKIARGWNIYRFHKPGCLASLQWKRPMKFRHLNSFMAGNNGKTNLSNREH